MESQLNIFKSNMLAEVQISYKTKIKPADRVKISKAKDIETYARSVWDEGTIEYNEKMMLILINRANEILGWVTVGTGGLTGVVCDQRVIFSIALTANACQIVLVHNHPSGNLTASNEDIQMTRKVKAGGDILGIAVLDHVILTADSYLSMAETGLM